MKKVYEKFSIPNKLFYICNNKLKLIQMKTLITIFFNSLGFVVSDSGTLYTKTKFARLIAELGVRDGSLQKKADNVYVASKTPSSR